MDNLEKQPSLATKVFCILITSMSFGLYPSGVRGAYAEGVSAIFLMLFATFMRGFAMTVVCAFQKQEIFARGSDAKNILFTGGIQTISLVSLYLSLKYLEGPIVAIFLFLSTIMLLVYGGFKKHIQLNKVIIITSLLCLLGLSLVMDVFHAKTSSQTIGYVLAFFAAIFNAIRLYLFQSGSQQKQPAVVAAETFNVAFIFLCGIAMFIPLSFPSNLSGWMWSLLAAGSLSVGTYTMFYTISIMGAFKFSLFNRMEPVFTSIYGALLLNEVLRWFQYLGMAILIPTLVFYQYYEHKRNKL